MTQIHVTINTTYVDASNNSIKRVTCGKNLIILRLNLRYNQLRNLQCIPKMVYLTNLDLSYNQLTSLSKVRLSKLTKMMYLNLLGNQLKNPGARLFSAYTGLNSLQIESLANYTVIKTFLPKLYSLCFLTKNFNCTQVESIAKVLRAQKIRFTFVAEYTNITSFKCRIPSSEFNKNPVT